MAVRAEPVSPGWKDGPLMQWLTTVDHKRIGLLYIWSGFLFFLGGGIMALLMRGQLARAIAHQCRRGVCLKAIEFVRDRDEGGPHVGFVSPVRRPHRGLHTKDHLAHQVIDGGK